MISRTSEIIRVGLRLDASWVGSLLRLFRWRAVCDMPWQVKN